MKALTLTSLSVLNKSIHGSSHHLLVSLRTQNPRSLRFMTIKALARKSMCTVDLQQNRNPKELWHRKSQISTILNSLKTKRCIAEWTYHNITMAIRQTAMRSTSAIGQSSIYLWYCWVNLLSNSWVHSILVHFMFKRFWKRCRNEPHGCLWSLGTSLWFQSHLLNDLY